MQTVVSTFAVPIRPCGHLYLKDVSSYFLSPLRQSQEPQDETMVLYMYQYGTLHIPTRIAVLPAPVPTRGQSTAGKDRPAAIFLMWIIRVPCGGPLADDIMCNHTNGIFKAFCSRRSVETETRIAWLFNDLRLKVCECKYCCEGYRKIAEEFPCVGLPRAHHHSCPRIPVPPAPDPTGGRSSLPSQAR